MKQKIVNLYGGPGAGKSTLAWALSAELKYRGVSVEYAPEVCKAAAWEGRGGAYWESQHLLWANQSWSLRQMRGKVNVIVTDSPLLLNLAYATKEWVSLIGRGVLADYDEYDNFDVFVNRSKAYVKEGRIQTAEEVSGLDSKIRGILGYYTDNEFTTVPGQRGSEHTLVEALEKMGWI